MEETLDSIGLKLKNRIGGKRVTLVGIGNVDKGDDGFGVCLVRELRKALKDKPIFECGLAPENYLGPIVRSDPQVIIVIDAASLGAEPGHVHIIEKGDIAHLGLSTHDASMKLFISYLENSLKDADILFLGVQPKSTSLSSKISKELKQTLLQLEAILSKIL